jgi:hypothetical protein
MVLPALLALPTLAKFMIGAAGVGAAVGIGRQATGTEMETDESEDGPAFGNNRSLFGEVMDFTQLAGQPIQNLFAGRFESAGRTAAETVLRLVDAFIPGDAIPSVARESDITSPTEVIADAVGGDVEDVPWYASLPVDIAGDIVTNPTSLLSFGGSGAATKVGQAAAQADNVGGSLAKVISQGGEKVAQAASKMNLTGAAPLMNAKPALVREAIESSLTRSGRKMINKSGMGISEFADDVIRSAGGTSADAIATIQRRISPGGDLARMFQQGGAQFAGKQFVAEGATSKAAGQLFGHMVDSAAKVHPSLGRALNTAGGKIQTAGGKVADFGASISGNVRGIAKPLLERLKMAKAKGAQTSGVASTNIIRIVSDLPEKARQGVMDTMFNIRQDAGKWTTLSPNTVPTKPFMTKAEQIDLAMDRVADMRLAGDAFADVSDEQIRGAISDIIDQNMTLYDQDVAFGVMSQPRMYTSQDGTMRHVIDLAKDHRDEIAALSDDSAKLSAYIEQQVEALGSARDELASLLGTGNVADDKSLSRIAELRTRISIANAALDDTAKALENSKEFASWLDASPYSIQDIDTSVMSPPLYMHRMFSLGDGASFIKARTLRDQDEFVEYLNAGAKLSNDMTEVMLRRAKDQGRLVSRAQLNRALLGDEAVLGSNADTVMDALFGEVAKTDPKLADALTNITTPLPKRGAGFETLHRINRFWKPAVLFGLGLPRFMVNIRNRLAGPFQEIGDAGARLSFQRIPNDIVQTFKFMGEETVEGVKKFRAASRKVRDGLADAAVDAAALKTPKDQIRRYLATLDDADVLAKGDVRRMPDAIRQAAKSNKLSDEQAGWLVEALDNGVLDGFVSTEELTRQVSRSMRKQAVADLLSVPASSFQHMEHRMRLAQFMDLRRNPGSGGAGASAAEAARAVQGAYLDYDLAGVADRNMRDIIPFAAFMTRTMPQQFAAVSRHGAYRSGLASVYGAMRNDVTLPPWIEEQAHVDLGIEDEQGNPIVAAGLGAPTEVLNLLPSNILSIRELAKTARRSVVAQSQPLLKEAFGQLSGEDPFFGTKIGSYDKVPEFLQPMFGESGEVGRQIQNLRRIGITAPLEPFLVQTDVALDEESGVGTKLLRLFTGVRVQSVDENRAAVQQLQDAIEDNPRIRSGEFIYSSSDDPATKQLVEMFKQAKARARR